VDPTGEDGEASEHQGPMPAGSGTVNAEHVPPPPGMASESVSRWISTQREFWRGTGAAQAEGFAMEWGAGRGVAWAPCVCEFLLLFMFRRSALTSSGYAPRSRTRRSTAGGNLR
jgi:hypothetical protein